MSEGTSTNGGSARWARWTTSALLVAAACLACLIPVEGQDASRPSIGEPVAVSGGLTTVGQTASDGRARSEVVGSIDVFVGIPFRRVRLDVYIEGNTTPFRDGVSRLVGEANTDAGTALDRRRRGRVQLSEVRLVAPVGGDLRLHGGLLDATGFLDVSRIANDENLFFLGVPFVNNPTIDFPDYSLGLAAEGRVPGTTNWEVGATITGSNGLADNPNVSYAQLLSLDDEEKGVFVGGALRWEGDGARASVGLWANSADRERLDGGAGTSTNRGAFAVAGWFRGSHSLSARAGLANERVTLAARFVGLTYLWARRPDAVGVAVARSFASEYASGASDVSHAELFVRRRLVREVFLTASVQRILNSGFDASGSAIDAGVWVAGVRLSAQF